MGRTYYSDDQKAEVVQYAKDFGNAEAVNKYKIAPSTVIKWVRLSNAYLEQQEIQRNAQIAREMELGKKKSLEITDF